MTMRDAITPADLARTDADTPIHVVGSREGYAVAVGPAERARWLHSTSGQFRTFHSLDQVIAVLRACCGARRFTVDLSGGTPQ